MLTEVVGLIVIGAVTFLIYITCRNGQRTSSSADRRTVQVQEIGTISAGHSNESIESECDLSAEVDESHHNQSRVVESDVSIEVDTRHHKESIESESDLSAEVDACHNSEPNESESDHSAEVGTCYQNESLVPESDLSTEVNSRHHTISLESESDLSTEVDACHTSYLSTEVDSRYHNASIKSESDLSAEVDTCHTSDLSTEVDSRYHNASIKSESDLSIEVDTCHSSRSIESESDVSTEVDSRHHNESIESESDHSAEMARQSQATTHDKTDDATDTAVTTDAVNDAVVAASLTASVDDDLSCNTAATSDNSDQSGDTQRSETTPPTANGTERTAGQSFARTPSDTSDTENQRFRNMKHLTEYILRTLNSSIYVTTRAHKKGETTLDDRGIVVLVGSPGSGKTTLGLYLMEHIRKIKQRQVLLLQHPSQFYDIQIPHNNLMSATEKEKLVILIDDIFGRSNLIDEYVQKWELNFPRLWELATAGLIKIIITCRSQIFQECENNLQEFDVFKKCHIVNLHDSEYCLTTDDETSLIDT